MDHRREVAVLHQDEVHEQARDLAGVLRPRIDVENAKVGLHGAGDRVQVPEFVRLHPFAELAHPVGDLLGRRNLVIVEAVQRVLPSVRVALRRLFRGQQRVKFAHEIQVDDRRLLGDARLAHEIDRGLVIPDLLIHRDQRDIADDALIDRRLQLGEREDDPFERVIVKNPRNVQPVAIILQDLRREARGLPPERFHPVVDLEKLGVHPRLLVGTTNALGPNPVTTAAT